MDEEADLVFVVPTVVPDRFEVRGMTRWGKETILYRGRSHRQACDAYDRNRGKHDSLAWSNLEAMGEQQ